MSTFLNNEILYVLNKEEQLLGVFAKDDEETVIDPQIVETQNAEAVLTFKIQAKNPKWNDIYDPENLYVLDGKVFTACFEDCIEREKDENDTDIISVTAYERQKLLSRKFVKAWNSEDGFDKIDDFMVVVLSGGNLELTNNGKIVPTTHLKGTSGYALDAILYGTDWTTGICDVPGTYDLETDQIDIYENIWEIQKLWGGIIVVDSINKVISHRDETLYLPYSGYEVRYKKNMKSLKYIGDNKIITKLCPLGEGKLNIASKNDGSIWLEDYSHTTSVFEAIEINDSITDPQQLKVWGQRKLEMLCQPRKELTVNTALLKRVEGFENEEVSLNAIVDVIDYDYIADKVEKLRIISYTHHIWDDSDAELEIGNITLESTDIFKQISQATNIVQSGTINSNKVVSFFENGKTITQSFKEVSELISDTTSLIYKTDSELGAAIKTTDGKVTRFFGEGSVDDIPVTLKQVVESIAQVQLDIDGLKVGKTITGGSNLIRNSVGIFGNEHWEGNIVQLTNTDIQNNSISSNAICLQNGSIIQNIINLKNGDYNVSFSYKKLLAAAECKVKINDVIYELTGSDDIESLGWKTFNSTINISDYKFNIEFISNSNDSCYITDLILIVGKEQQHWSQNQNETTTDNVTIGEGIQVDSSTTNTYTRIDSDGNRTFNKLTGNVVMEATDKGVETENLVVRTEAKITGILQQKVGNQVWESIL